jgi:hypothetical protein
MRWRSNRLEHVQTALPTIARLGRLLSNGPPRSSVLRALSATDWQKAKKESPFHVPNSRGDGRRKRKVIRERHMLSMQIRREVVGRKRVGRFHH